MTISLEITHSPDLVRCAGGEQITITEGNRLQVRHNESGEIEEILNEVTPEGEEWDYSISITVVKRTV